MISGEDVALLIDHHVVQRRSSTDLNDDSLNVEPEEVTNQQLIVTLDLCSPHAVCQSSTPKPTLEECLDACDMVVPTSIAELDEILDAEQAAAAAAEAEKIASTKAAEEAKVAAKEASSLRFADRIMQIADQFDSNGELTLVRTSELNAICMKRSAKRRDTATQKLLPCYAHL